MRARGKPKSCWQGWAIGSLAKSTRKAGNLESYVALPRKCELLKEINGREITRNSMLDALETLNEKAVAFKNNFFAEHMVVLKACDFRTDLKVVRSDRVALCEDRRLSIRRVGQRVHAIILDKDKIPSMSRAELHSFIVDLGRYYNVVSYSKEGPAKKKQSELFAADIAAASMARMNISA